MGFFIKLKKSSQHHQSCFFSLIARVMLQAEGRLLGQRGGGEEGHGGKGFEGEVETGRQSRSRIQKSAVYASTLPKRGPTPPSGSSPITNKEL